MTSCLGGGGGGAGLAGDAAGLTSGFANFCSGFARFGTGFAGVCVGDVVELRLSCASGLTGCVDVTAGFPGATAVAGVCSSVLGFCPRKSPFAASVGEVSLVLTPFAAGLVGAVVGAVATGAAGVLPLPGTGSAFSLRNCCGWLVVFAGVTGAVPGLAVALIEALRGAGNLPSRISEARCATLAGNVGVGAAVPAGGAGLLITVLMTVVLWMLLKMTLFGGGWT